MTSLPLKFCEVHLIFTAKWHRVHHHRSTTGTGGLGWLSDSSKDLQLINLDSEEQISSQLCLSLYLHCCDSNHSEGEKNIFLILYSMK